MISTGQAALSGVLMLALSWVSASCAPRVGEAQFVCDPERAEPCPPGFKCLFRAGTQEHRCYREKGSYCGDGVAAPEEECDGTDLHGTVCADLGYFAGRPVCTARCQLDPTPCRRLASVALGASHGCGLDDEGQAWCWGQNEHGQLGTGILRVSPQPEAVTSDATFVELAVTDYSSCGLDVSGQAFCWGSAPATGTGATQGGSNLTSPRPVASEVRFDSITAGLHDFCGLDAEGRVWCWGGSPHGTAAWLPEDTPPPVVPTRTAFDQRFVELAVGIVHYCGLDADGTAHCWGDNNPARLGVDPESYSGDGTYLPVAVEDVPPFQTLVAGTYRTCGLDAEGVLYCWGIEGPFTSWEEVPARAVPLVVQPQLRFVAAADGDLLTCGIDLEGSTWCWRHFDEVPSAMLAGLVVVKLWLGAQSQTICGATVTGEIHCEGWNGAGLAGKLATPAPRRAIGLPMTTLSGGLEHGCGLGDQGRAYCWGTDYNWQLGLGYSKYDSSFVPEPVAGGHEWAALSVGLFHTCGLNVGGSVWCWGGMGAGALGMNEGDATGLPVLASPHDHVGISAGQNYSCAVDLDNGAWCWGENTNGQLGTGDFSASSMPRPVVQSDTNARIHFAAVRAGYSTTCGLDTGGKAWCWGGNGRGGCGSTAAPVNALNPQAVETELTFSGLATGGQGACGLADGRILCWGWGEYGQLGNGYDNNEWHPVMVVGGGHFVELGSGAGLYHFCGITDAEELWCWGGNDSGQLGDGTFVNRLVPTRVEIEVPVASVSMGPLHTCAVDVDDGVWCWGRNVHGQLGIDDTLVTPRQLSTTAQD